MGTMRDEEELIETGEELYEHYRFVCDPGQTLLRIDKFLMDRVANTSRSKIKAAAQSGNILVNGKAVKQNYRVKPLDVISVVLPYPVREIELIPQNIPLDIVYEDDEVVVVNKPAGLVVHPGYGNYSGTLVNALLFHFGQLPPAADGNPVRPGLVHRIDKLTSGLLVVAKTEQAHTHLARQFFEHTADRRYLALVWGELTEPGTITGYLARSAADRKVMAVYADETKGKHAVTHYEVMENLGYVTLVRCKLETGRTHQIRVSFQHIGHPLFNDPEYGGNRIVKGTVFTKYRQFVENCFALLPGQALHAQTLGFEHPSTGKRMHFEAPLPDGFEQILNKWRTYRQGH